MSTRGGSASGSVSDYADLRHVTVELPHPGASSLQMADSGGASAGGGDGSASAHVIRVRPSFAIAREKVSERVSGFAKWALEGPIHVDVPSLIGSPPGGSVPAAAAAAAGKEVQTRGPGDGHAAVSTLSSKAPYATVTVPTADAATHSRRRALIAVLRFVGMLTALYSFMVGLVLMGDAFQVVGGKAAGSMFSAIASPLAGLVVGVIATVLVQSSSTSSSIVVGLVGSGIMSVSTAIPVIMGSNIGTSVTNTIVAMGHMRNPREYRRAFAGATVHDVYNVMSVVLLLTTEVVVRAATPGPEGGLLFEITGALTNALAGGDGSDASGGSFESPVKAAVSPLVQMLLKIDKDKIEALSVGAPTVDSCLPGPAPAEPLVVAGVNYQACGNATAAALSAAHYDAHVQHGSLLTSGAWVDAGASDTLAGTVSLLLGLCVIIFSMYWMVKLLHALVSGATSKFLKKAVALNGVAAIVVGAVATMIVQSSSIVTSTLTPLVGIGALSLEQMYPLTIGANLGTTVTGLLASLAAGTRPALQIALSNVVFNIFKALLWYPVPRMRQIPLDTARWLGRWAAQFRWFAPLYILLVFVVVPLMLLGLTSLYSAGGVLLGVGIALTVLMAVASFLFAFWYYHGGREAVNGFLHFPPAGIHQAHLGEAPEHETRPGHVHRADMFLATDTSAVVGREVDTIAGRGWVLGVKSDDRMPGLRLVVQLPWGVAYLTGRGIYGAANPREPLQSQMRAAKAREIQQRLEREREREARERHMGGDPYSSGLSTMTGPPRPGFASGASRVTDGDAARASGDGGGSGGGGGGVVTASGAGGGVAQASAGPSPGADGIARALTMHTEASDRSGMTTIDERLHDFDGFGGRKHSAATTPIVTPIEAGNGFVAPRDPAHWQVTVLPVVDDATDGDGDDVDGGGGGGRAAAAGAATAAGAEA